MYYFVVLSHIIIGCCIMCAGHVPYYVSMLFQFMTLECLIMENLLIKWYIMIFIQAGFGSTSSMKNMCIGYI